ncbi:MAG: VWA-like domain-containing protein [Elusimicrobiales bacterium]|nr:VWA-like domain-containing protein [Elusimicrobiales bacterium]
MSYAVPKNKLVYKINMNVKERIQKIAEKWFLLEPLLFSVLCTHEITPSNGKLVVPFRTGRKRVEYCEERAAALGNEHLEEYLKIEMFRILLKHPYQRQPPSPDRAVLTFASNATINDVYKNTLYLPGPDDIKHLPANLCFEEYYARIKDILENRQTEKKNSNSGNDYEYVLGRKEKPGRECCTEKANQAAAGGNDIGSADEAGAEQISSLWEEDEEIQAEINTLIEIAEETDSWGTLSGSFRAVIEASMKINMDYRKMLRGFRTSVLSGKRRLTRMRPSRRFGFMQLGSRRESSANLIVAVDVSGSVSDNSLQKFFSVINRFFKYGIHKLDIIQFDSQITGKPLSIDKARTEVKILGRGGTNFQPVADYYCTHPEYDGLICFTDGHAPKPVFNTKRLIDVLWVMCGKRQYDEYRNEIRQIKRNRITYIPSA